jgi:hypothetical protein
VPPDPARPGDATGVMTLFNAARLSLRSGAALSRSLGRISVTPRPYQFVPLIMALRLDPVRLLIADDVGVRTTIEAGMIARELFDLPVLSEFSQWKNGRRFGFDRSIPKAPAPIFGPTVEKHQIGAARRAHGDGNDALL